MGSRRLFVASSSREIELAESIAHKFEEKGFEVYLPEWKTVQFSKFSAVDKWKEILEEHSLLKQIQESNVVLVVNKLHDEELDGLVYAEIMTAHLSNKPIFFLGTIPPTLPVVIPPQRIYDSLERVILEITQACAEQ